jgi:peptide chain release factor 1
MDIFAKLKNIQTEFIEIEKKISSSESFSNVTLYKKLMQRYKQLANIINKFDELKSTISEINNAKQILTEDDYELVKIAQEELEELNTKKENYEKELMLLMLPKDPYDEKNVIMEIRAGTGGEEAALFTAALLKMYRRYAERNLWKVELMDSHPTGLGGFKEVTISIEGENVYSKLKYESGVHRVQRIPVTESGGRIHTSAVTVAVLPQPDEIEININPSDLKIDAFKSTGPGGQGVNTTDSAVRITHIPTGIIVTCRDERSQTQNKNKALKILNARIFDKLKKEQQEKISNTRKNLIGSGDRSEKIRTYNFPQNRITDHRINLTLYKLDAVLNGDIDKIITNIIFVEQTEKIKEIALK